MRIGGLLRFSLIDYPGKMAAVIFTQGCNFRCPYCQNPELVFPSKFCVPVPEGEVLAFLEKRRGQLEGVVITGGEPTIQKDLIPFLRRLRGLPYAVKLDTNGSRPDVLEDVFAKNLVDYVAMDVKAPLEKYASLTTIPHMPARIQESIRLIMGSGIRYEFRTTLAKPFVLEEDLPALHALIPGAAQYRLQPFIMREHLVDPARCTPASENFSADEVRVLRARWAIPACH